MNDDAEGANVALGYDHAGFSLAGDVSDFLVGTGKTVLHFGPPDARNPDDYPYFCLGAAEAVSSSLAAWGVVIGGSGQGEQIAANKVKGIRAALCVTPEYALLARQDNDANVVALPGRLISGSQAREILSTWMATPFDGGRHERRIDQIRQYEMGTGTFQDAPNRICSASQP